MNYGRGLLGVFKALGLPLILGVSLSACGSGGEKWQEEVQLSDGRVIVIERETIREAGGDEWSFNRGGSKPKEYRIRYTNPEIPGKMIEWRSTKISPRTWPEVPLIFDITSGKLNVFSLVATSNGCEMYSRYVYQDGVWTDAQLAERFPQYSTNLLFGSRKELPTLVNLEEKKKRNDGVGYRNALKHVGPNVKVCDY